MVHKLLRKETPWFSRLPWGLAWGWRASYVLDASSWDWMCRSRISKFSVTECGHSRLWLVERVWYSSLLWYVGICTTKPTVWLTEPPGCQRWALCEAHLDMEHWNHLDKGKAPARYTRLLLQWTLGCMSGSSNHSAQDNQANSLGVMTKEKQILITLELYI